MVITCLDLEGVLVPEIWIAFAEATGIPELKRTTRDEPDYDSLMKFRINILKKHGLGLKEIQDVISTIEPMEGAKEFLDELRSICQVIIISDTFTQFAAPLMKKLGMPTIFCNELVVSDSGEVVDFKMRCDKSKYTTVKALPEGKVSVFPSGTYRLSTMTSWSIKQGASMMMLSPMPGKEVFPLQLPNSDHSVLTSPVNTKFAHLMNSKLWVDDILLPSTMR